MLNLAGIWFHIKIRFSTLFIISVTALPADGHTSHPALRSRVSVVGGPHQNLAGTAAPAGGHFTQITLSDEDSGSSSDKMGPYKTTTNINR